MQNEPVMRRLNSILSHGSAGTTHVTRGSVAKTPYFSWNISCLAVIMGVTGDSGLNPGWDGIGEMATIPNEFRESQASAPGFQFRAGIGRFQDRKASSQPLVRRGMLCNTPCLSREDFVSGRVSGRDG